MVPSSCNGVQGVTGLSSGVLISSEGWATLNIYAIPLVALTALASLLLWLGRRSGQTEQGKTGHI